MDIFTISCELQQRGMLSASGHMTWNGVFSDRYDVPTRRVGATPPASETFGTSSSSRDVQEKKLVLELNGPDHFLGLNIRGGREYGVGIYVSR